MRALVVPSGSAKGWQPLGGQQGRPTTSGQDPLPRQRQQLMPNCPPCGMQLLAPRCSAGAGGDGRFGVKPAMPFLLV